MFWASELILVQSSDVVMLGLSIEFLAKKKRYLFIVQCKPCLSLLSECVHVDRCFHCLDHSLDSVRPYLMVAGSGGGIAAWFCPILKTFSNYPLPSRTISRYRSQTALHAFHIPWPSHSLHRIYSGKLLQGPLFAANSYALGCILCRRKPTNSPKPIWQTLCPKRP